MWQLGAMSVSPGVREAAELIIGNLSEDGYLIASEKELLEAAMPPVPGARPGLPESEPEPPARVAADTTAESDMLVSEPGEEAIDDLLDGTPSSLEIDEFVPEEQFLAQASSEQIGTVPGAEIVATMPVTAVEEVVTTAEPAVEAHRGLQVVASNDVKPLFTRDELHEAISLVQLMDPVGVAARDLRECLLAQLTFLQQAHNKLANGNGTGETLADAIIIVSDHLRAVQNKQLKEISKAINRPVEAVQAALDLVKTLDPRPGLRYNKESPRLIEPDVAFIKHGDEYLAVLNDDDVPQLRLNTTYKKLLSREATEKDVRNYVKERYKSAIQLIKNIEQRKQTILKVCYSILGRQRDFLDHGIDQLKPMMIKEVAEEIGVHPSTVSRAVANKYAHTPQGVFELRYFFSESVNGPEGSNTSLLILKRRVKKLIDEEDPTRPLTDEQITRILQSQGIQVTRRTVAKYREDMHIPSTHQRRVKN